MELNTTSSTWFGSNAPFIDAQGNVLSRQVDVKLIQNDLLQLLLTSPGNRVHRPDYGVGVRTFLFEGQDTTALTALKQRIFSQVAKYESRVTLTDVIFQPNDNNTLTIKLYGTVVLDRFSNAQNLANADLLVELNIPTGTSGNG